MRMEVLPEMARRVQAFELPLPFPLHDRQERSYHQISTVLRAVETTFVVGAAAYCAVSKNRGVEFVFVPIPTVSAKLVLRDVVFVTPVIALAFGGSTLVRIDVSTNPVTASALRKFSSPIGGITRLRRPTAASAKLAEELFMDQYQLEANAPTTQSTSPGAIYDVVVSTGNELHFTFDFGGSFTTIAHGLGLIRRLVDITELYTSHELAELIRPAEEQKPQKPGAKPAGDEAKTKTYSYAATTVLGCDDEKEAKALSVRLFPLTATSMTKVEGEPPLRCFAILGSSGPIVDYDFTGLLTLRQSDVVPEGMSKQQEDSMKPFQVIVSTNVTRLQFVPFTKSQLQEKVGLVVLRRLGGGVTWVRSTMGGLCISNNNGASFSDPTQAYTGTLVQLDETTVVSCNLKKSIVITQDGGNTWSLVAIPTNLRVAALFSIAVMR